MKELPPFTPPQFCRQDGMQLIDKRTPIESGYDVLTGVRLPAREHVTRECPTKNHDVWVLTDSGHWVRP